MYILKSKRKIILYSDITFGVYMISSNFDGLISNDMYNHECPILLYSISFISNAQDTISTPFVSSLLFEGDVVKPIHTSFRISFIILLLSILNFNSGSGYHSVNIITLEATYIFKYFEPSLISISIDISYFIFNSYNYCIIF